MNSHSVYCLASVMVAVELSPLIVLWVGIVTLFHVGLVNVSMHNDQRGNIFPACIFEHVLTARSFAARLYSSAKRCSLFSLKRILEGLQNSDNINGHNNYK